MSGQFGSAFPARPGYPTQQPVFPPTPSHFDPFAAVPPRKRRADSPPADFGHWPTPSPGTKRRRPNLHNGFATMSISRPDGEPQHPQTYSQTSDGSDEDDGLEPTRPPLDGDVAVEVLSDKHPSPTSARRPGLLHRRSSSSTSPSEEDYESDATYRPPLERQRLRDAHNAPMQPTSIEHPENDEPPPETPYGTPTVEPFESPLKRKHLRMDDDWGRAASKRQRSHMDAEGDMEMDDMRPIASGPGWYEPEKDRIVVTSLSSPESSGERSPSPDPGPRRGYSYEEHKHLTQPGAGGFTISPSLLTHLMAAQSDQFRPAPFAVPERGLVLYRPIGAPPEDIVRQWEDDAGRFEEVDDDEDLMQADPAVGVPLDAPWGDGVAQEWGQPSASAGDDAMDIE